MSGVDFNMAVIGPTLRKQARGGFMQAVEALPAELLKNPPATVTVDGEEIPVPANSFTPKVAYRVAGEEVDVLTLGGDVVVTIGHQPDLVGDEPGDFFFWKERIDDDEP